MELVSGGSCINGAYTVYIFLIILLMKQDNELDIPKYYIYTKVKKHARKNDNKKIKFGWCFTYFSITSKISFFCLTIYKHLKFSFDPIWGLNPEPLDSDSNALSTELMGLFKWYKIVNLLSQNITFTVTAAQNQY